MSFFAPTPLMIVVFSFSMRTRLALPSICSVTFYKLDAEILRDHVARGKDRDVFEHRFTAVSRTRRLHGRHLQAAAQLVDDERRQRLALDILGDDEQRVYLLAATASRRGSIGCSEESFFSWIRIYASSSSASIFSALVTK